MGDKWAAIAIGMLLQACDYYPKPVLHTGQKAQNIQEEQWMSNNHHFPRCFPFIYIYSIYNRKANSEILAFLFEQEIKAVVSQSAWLISKED